MTIKLDNIEYKVGVATVSRSIRHEEKYRVKTEDGRIHREVKATYVDFALHLGNIEDAEYNRLVAYLRATPEDITVELPCGSTEVETYTGAFDSIADEVVNEDTAGVVMWDNLTLSFTCTQPTEVLA